ncbi:hypothetical protein GALMADRAFT_136016 [Galerina marginata CBS 339.88]|uniref:Uncharacterized protein n=1 Tax=Galerina marginata (strain CBS 339.88) TaxID=685588 RepID=A0A067TPS5_GALM3|nr:hypothetical protein GALMADRAFT_136016 [Galerina marginata CBS 339.88]
MSSATPTLVIPFIASELPTCNPNLMPFHINYTGPAAVSAFMRVEKAKLEDKVQNTGEKDATVAAEGPEDSNVDTDMKVDASVTLQAQGSFTTEPDAHVEASGSAAPTTEAESQSLSIRTESTLVIESQTSLASDATQVLSPVLEDSDKRFVSTFRGRTIHGLTIDLPEGYGGLVLQTQEETGSGSVYDKEKDSNNGKGKDSSEKKKESGTKSSEAKETGKPRGRLTRSAVSKRVEVITVEDEDEVMADPEHNLKSSLEDTEASTETPDDRPVRNLVPTAQFTSFTLWHPDRPVDKGSDEYYRTLTEWIALSHEIHRTDL